MNDFNLQTAIHKRKILPFPDGPKIVLKEYQTAKDDLREAKESFKRGSYKWTTTQAYYTFFHAFRALLYKKKYREKSHIQLAFAIREIYVNQGLLPEEYYDGFIQAMDLREMADYKRKFSKTGAERSIEAAEKAVKFIGKLLK